LDVSKIETLYDRVTKPGEAKLMKIKGLIRKPNLYPKMADRLLAGKPLRRIHAKCLSF
jgi:hypothetical protein